MAVATWMDGMLSTRRLLAPKFPRTSLLCMTQYDKLCELPVIIPPESLDNILTSIIAQHQVN